MKTRLDGKERVTWEGMNVSSLTSSNCGFSATRTGTTGPVSLGMQAKSITTDRSLQGEIAELLWFNEGLSDTWCAQVEKYLSQKYSIALVP
ncbi:MAG TPA: hypothetical protein VGL77_12685 [Armatimonadota bacterium]